MSVQSTFQGEVQLAGWRESHNSGAVVSFWLPDPAELEVFRGLTAKKGNTAGHRFMAVLVEIGDDEQPVAPNIGAGSSEHYDDGKKKGGALAQWAALRCKENSFFEFIRPVYDKYMGGDGSGYGDGVCGDLSENEKAAEEFCRHAILVLCGVDSRAELDTDKYAKIRFDEVIRLPYMAWLQGKR